MLESERGLWLRGAVLLILAPMVFALFVYAALPWVDPTISESARSLASLCIGFGTGMCFTGIFLLGIRSGRLSELEQADRIWLFVHALSLIAMGLGAVLIGSFRGAGVSSVGLILLVGGVGTRIVALIVRWIWRWVDRSGVGA